MTDDKVRREWLADVRDVMSKASGRRVMYQMLEDSGLFRTVFSTDALVMAFNEGKRNTGLRLISDLLEACPEKYMTMIQAAKEREEKEARDREQSRADATD